MFSKVYVFTLPISFLFITGCGGTTKKSTNDYSSTESSDYSYFFEENFCPTGQQRFSSLESMCEGLKDDALNKGCAKDMRRDYFEEKGCPGEFEPAPAPAPVTQQPAPKPAPKPTPAPVDKAVARQSFEKTMAYGSREIHLKDFAFAVARKDLAGVVLEETQLVCKSTKPVKIIGTFPDVNFFLGELDCPNSGRMSTSAELALSRMKRFASMLEYTATHIPADSAPNQFRLDLIPRSSLAIPRRDSLNALASDNFVFFDFVGVEKTSFDESRYFFSALLDSNKDSKESLFQLSFSQNRRPHFGDEEVITIEGSTRIP